MYWSGERLGEECGGGVEGCESMEGCRGGVECGVKEWRRKWGAMLCTLYILSI